MAGNQELVRNAPIKTDIGQPTASALVTVTAVTTSTADIAWEAGTDVVSGVSGYDVYADGTLVASTSATGTVLTGLAPNTAYSITVVTIDVAGNRSVESPPAYAVTDLFDPNPPTTTLTLSPTTPNGADGWYVTDPIISLTSSKPGASYYSWTSSTGPFSPYSVPFSAELGDQTLYYYSVDTASHEEIVRNAPIKTDVGQPTASTLVTVTAVTTSTADVAWEAGTDGVSGVSRYEVFLDGAVTPATSTSATGTVLTGLTPNTGYAITVVTIDAAGNRSPVSLPANAITNPLDTTPPTTTLTVSPSAPDGNSGWYVTTPNVTLSSSEPGTTYYGWSSPIGPFSTYLAPFSALAGNQTLYYYSTDVAGNEEVLQNAPIKTDGEQPTASALVTVTAVTTSTADIAWEAGADGISGVAGYQVYADGILAVSTSATGTALTGLAPNTSYEITVVTVDVAGNRSPASASVFAVTDLFDPNPPTTTLTLSPAAPNGSNGWYVSTPIVSLTSSKPGISYFSWASSTGPFSTYSAPFSADPGNQTVYYYSVDTASHEETVQSAQIKTDVDPPTASTLVTVTAVTTSTADVAWAAGTDGVSGVSGYDVYANGVLATSTSATGTVLTGLTPNTGYAITVVTIDAAGNRSPVSLPANAITNPLDTSPLTTTLSVSAPTPDGSNGWYVTTPTVTMSAEPSTAPASIYFSWESTTGPYSIYAGATTPPEGSSILYFSAHDGALPAVRADEPTRQAPFLVDTLAPAAPSVTASVTSYSSVRLTWPAVLGTPSGISRYDVYRDGTFLVSVTDPFIDVVGLAQGTTYGFVVYAANVAGTVSAGSTNVETTTPTAPLPFAPSVVFAESLSGNSAYVNWSAVSTGTVGAVSYRIWRSENGSTFSAIATATGGAYDATLIDSAVRASTRYWYAVSTIDARGESALSSTGVADWASISTTSTGPQRPLGLTGVESSATVALSWQASPNPATVGYRVMRGGASLTTPTVLTPLPVTGTAYFDLTVQNGQTYYYSVAAVDASGVVGSPSLELEAKPHGLVEGTTPHITGSDASACICHSSHTAAAPNTGQEPGRPHQTNKLIRFPGTTVNSMCNTCHLPASAFDEFVDPLAKSRHNLDATVSASAPFTCLTCHRPVTGLNEPAANLMRVNGSWVCTGVTGVPAGDGFCYSCHGVGSALPEGDLTVFEGSVHASVTAPATGANIKCDACHESHSSRNEQLLTYSSYMMCLQCHTPTASNPNTPDLWSRLTLNPDANAKHPLLPQDQTGGAAMSCQNCHNTHAVTQSYPLVDPHDPKPGTWQQPTSDQKAFCFRCHNGKALPTSAETTPWAGPVLASGAATTVTDIEAAYQVNVHGFGAESDPGNTTAYLRPDMGYQYDTVLECRSCHDPHGSANNFTLLQDVSSADGTKVVKGVVVAKVPTGGYDLRFFCGACHDFNPITHDVASMANTSTVNFPMDCTACHRHMETDGTTPSKGL